MGTLGSIIYIIGLLLAAIGGLWMLALAFQESFMWALGMLLLGPFVGFFYFLTHLRETWKPFLLQIIGICIYIIGQVILAVVDVTTKIDYHQKKNGQGAPSLQAQAAPQEQAPTYFDALKIEGKNVLKNGKFSKKLKSWTEITDGKGKIAVSTRTEGESRVLLLQRQNSGNDSAEGGVSQNLNLKLEGIEQLVLTAELKPEQQTMPGTGRSSGEFPIGIRLRVEDENRGGTFWTIGLFIEGDNQYPHLFKVPVGQWTKIQKDLSGFFPDTAVIKYIQIVGGGWDFRGQADNLALYVKRK